MRYYKKLNFFFIIFFLTISSVKSNEQIVYLNLDNVISGTKSGKLIIENLKKSRTVALAKFEKKEKELKRIEEDINKQKNILSQEQLTKKISDFRRDISSFRKEREELVNSFNSTWENETAYIGVGGSIPFANDFVREFPNAELVLIGAADEELGNAHAPNESVQIDHIEMLVESLVKTLKNI